MARRKHGLELTRQSGAWASDDAAVVSSPETQSDGALNRQVGFPADFGRDRYAELGLFNFTWRELTDTLIDLARHGVLEWDTKQPYNHPAIVFGSDSELYVSLRDSLGQDPVSSPLDWRSLGSYASSADVAGGSVADAAITPAGLLSLFAASVASRWQATEDKFGLARLATLNDVAAGVRGDRVVTPAALQRQLLAPKASPAFTGNVGVPTRAAGDNTAHAASTAFVVRALMALMVGTAQLRDDAVTGPKIAADAVGLEHLASTVRGVRTLLYHANRTNLNVTSNRVVNLNQSFQNFGFIRIGIRPFGYQRVFEGVYRVEDFPASGPIGTFSFISSKTVGTSALVLRFMDLACVRIASQNRQLSIHLQAVASTVEADSVEASTRTSIVRTDEVWIYGES